MVVWKEDFGIGIAAIDAQHQKLFEITNKVYKLLNNDLLTDKYDQIVAVIEELRNYTIEHFAAEEAYMQEINYRKFLSHKAIHNDFIERIEAVDLSKIDNEQNLYLKEILNFVTDWLISHILQTDKLITTAD